MLGPHWTRACAALVLGLGAAACSTPPPKAAGEPSGRGPGDEWKRSATWLYATGDAKGGPAAECDAVRKLLGEETRCRGPLCRFGLELAGEWRQKCDKLAPGAVDEVSTRKAELDDRMEREPTTCSRDFERLLKDACQGEECVERAQRWVTRCGESDAGPLCIAMLERMVERALGPDEAPRLDARSCATMAKAVREASQCAGESACRDAWPDVEGYLARCSTEGSKPDLPTALALEGIALGAEREPKPIAIADEPKQVAPGDLALALADGSGAILEICHRRVVDRAEYFAARDKCQGTRMSVARIFAAKGGGRELRVGNLLVPEQQAIPSLYPAFELAGELDELAQRKLEQIRTELAAVTGSPEAAAAGQLVAFVDRNSDWLERSEAVRQAVRGADGKLVPVLRKLGEAKASAMRTSRDALAERGLLERARTRALADLGADGTVQLGAMTRAFWLDTAKLWPEASTAHVIALATLERTVKNSPRPSAATLETQLTRARAQAKACGAAVRDRLAAEQALLACVFEGCDDARRAELADRWQKARTAADGARQELDLSLAPLGQSALDAPIAVEAGCVKPKR